MRVNLSSHLSFSPSNADFLRRYARRLLRDARSAQPSKILPVMRRVYAAGVFPQQRLSELYHKRASLLLKHILRTLAVELGYAAWADCKRDVNTRPASVLDRFQLDLGAFSDFHQIWFRNESSARQWRQQHCGHVVVYGGQAVVMTA